MSISQGSKILASDVTAHINNKNNQINIINGDVKNYYNLCNSDTYDVITCNPPFFKFNKESKLNKSDYKTIARHEVTLNLDDIMKVSSKLLKNNGVIGIVHRPDRMIDIIEAMRKYNIEPKQIQFVYPKKKTDANILLVEGRKNGNATRGTKGGARGNGGAAPLPTRESREGKPCARGGKIFPYACGT